MRRAARSPFGDGPLAHRGTGLPPETRSTGQDGRTDPGAGGARQRRGNERRTMKRFSGRLNSMRIILAIVASIIPLGWMPVAASSVTSRQIGRGTLHVDLLSDTPVVSSGDDLPAGFHRLLDTDLPLLQEAGRPELPYRTLLVGLPEGQTIEVTA